MLAVTAGLLTIGCSAGADCRTLAYEHAVAEQVYIAALGQHDGAHAGQVGEALSHENSHGALLDLRAEVTIADARARASCG